MSFEIADFDAMKARGRKVLFFGNVRISTAEINSLGFPASALMYVSKLCHASTGI
jgi:hypothetical protein